MVQHQHDPERHLLDGLKMEFFPDRLLPLF